MKDLKYSVIIESIGTASPAIAKVLSNSFEIQEEIILKLLYNTPSVLIHKVDESIALRAKELLNSIGLDVKTQSSDEPLPNMPETVDVGVFLKDVSLLPKVCIQLSNFLGCEQKEALNLLINEPSIVLGRVSKSTAIALSKRIDAEVLITNPEFDYYTVIVNCTDDYIIRQIKSFLKKKDLIAENGQIIIKDLDYKLSRDLWYNFQTLGKLQIINQSFLRYEIILENVDILNPSYRDTLINQVGIPNEIIDEILKYLPVQLEDSLNSIEVHEKLLLYEKAGLICTSNMIPLVEYKVEILKISDLERTKEILKKFFPEDSLPEKDKLWMSPFSLKNLLARYTFLQLNEVGCLVELKEYINGN